MQSAVRLSLCVVALAAGALPASCASAPKRDVAAAPETAPLTKRYRFIGKAMGARVELTIDEKNDADG